MPRTYDDRRWILNEDGSYTRRVPPGKVVQQAPAEPSNDNYYKDITTTGAAADLAQELGIDLSEVEGTGLHGKITKGDVEKYAAAH